MTRTLLYYGLAIAGAAVLLQWLGYRVTVHAVSTELYIVVIAAGFTGLGIWAGYRLTAAPRAEAFEPNSRAVASLGISGRELEVLELLAEGHSNREIADRLHVSPHTVKTHLGHLYGKLDVSRRTQAVQKARELRILP